MKIQLKRSNQLDGGSAKEPTVAQMEFGELAVNYNSSDPVIFIKNSDNDIIRIAGAGAESGGIPDGGTGERPTNPSVGDLFFDTDLNIIVYWDGTNWQPVAVNTIIQPTAPNPDRFPEGTLWWNSDATSLQLYVNYNDPAPDAGNKWIEASPMPDAPEVEGYPNLEDGDGTTIDARYVKKVGDNMTGNLTLGTDKVTLNATSGSATFAGKVDASELVAYNKTDVASTNCIRVFSDVGTETSVKVEIKADGSARFAGTVESTKGDIAFFANASLVNRGTSFRSIDNNVGSSDHHHFHGSDKDGNGNVFINTDGSATFTSSVKCQVLSAESDIYNTWFRTNLTLDSQFYIWAGKNQTDNVWNSGVQKDGKFVLGNVGTQDYKVQISAADGSAEFAGKVDASELVAYNKTDVASTNCIRVFSDVGTETSVKVEIKADGSARFAGTVTLDSDLQVGDYPGADGVSIYPGSITVRRDSGQILEAYSGGTDVANRSVQITSAGAAVFAGTVTANGTILTRSSGTLDVGDRLEKVDNALQALKAAVTANSTLDELRAAIISALTDV